jgi:hypothetical protein
MKRYLELDPALLDQINMLRLVLEIEFRKLREGETLLWVVAGTDGMRELDDATIDLPDTVIMSIIPPFPGDTSVVIASLHSLQIIQQRLAGVGWEKASPDDEAEFRRHLERHRGEYWESLAPEQRERRIAEDIAWWEETKRRRDEDERYLASLTPEQREREEKRRDKERLASMRPREREEELQRRREIHFGTLRIPMCEMITFTGTGAHYMVASGTGRPENGGVLLAVPGEGLFSIRLLTRRLMGKEFDEDGDVWALWEYKGETLRNIFGRYFLGN